MITDAIKKMLPEKIKMPIRRIRRKIKILLSSVKMRKNREIKIRLFLENYDINIKKWIVFLTPGFDIVNGGILSISSLYLETAKLKHIHGANTLLCTVPGDPPLLKYTKFKNDNIIYELIDTLRYIPPGSSVLIHIPEYALHTFVKEFGGFGGIYRLINRRNISCDFNIMLQNIKQLPPTASADIQFLKRFGKVTVTTAHKRYCTLENARQFGVPFHLLSVFVSPEKYVRKQYSEKENLMIISPDYHKDKQEIIETIKRNIPDLKIIEIKNMKYEDYKKTIENAKWALTFGEGLDGYFVETIFSGGIAFAVYNEEFFTTDFKTLQTVYPDYKTLQEQICKDIKRMDTEREYTAYQEHQYALCAKYYNYHDYVRNLEAFYKGGYTHAID